MTSSSARKAGPTGSDYDARCNERTAATRAPTVRLQVVELAPPVQCLTAHQRSLLDIHATFTDDVFKGRG